MKITKGRNNHLGASHILIIDDEPVFRLAMADYLGRFGYATTTAADGQDGLDRARAKHFDAVLVDLHMPRVDGFQVIAALKAEQPELPVVVVTGTRTQSHITKAMQWGAWDYLSKPLFDLGEIRVVVERVLARRSMTVAH